MLCNGYFVQPTNWPKYVGRGCQDLFQSSIHLRTICRDSIWIVLTFSQPWFLKRFGIFMTCKEDRCKESALWCHKSPNWTRYLADEANYKKKNAWAWRFNNSWPDVVGSHQPGGLQGQDKTSLRFEELHKIYWLSVTALSLPCCQF